jgi:N6-adenosine-specific RNA methylase IME4
MFMKSNNASSTQSMTEKKYSVILADPPWDVQQKGAYGAERHYSLMSLERIKELPVADLASENAHLWLWVTNATLRDGYDVMESWGFTPRSPLTWIKPRFTLGVYLRNASEHVILGTRGKAPVKFKSQPTWMFAPLQDHSHKPEEQYAIIERVSGEGPRLELFARRRQPGWDAWGNEVESDIEIPGFPVPRTKSTRQARQPRSRDA